MLVLMILHKIYLSEKLALTSRHVVITTLKIYHRYGTAIIVQYNFSTIAEKFYYLVYGDALFFLYIYQNIHRHNKQNMFVNTTTNIVAPISF